MNKYLFLLLVLLISLSDVLIAQTQADEITAKYFPNPKLEINTPAFRKDSGFTNYNELISFITELSKGNENLIKTGYIGESVLGKKIPMLHLGYNNSQTKVRIWLQAGLHGNEPAGTEGLLMLLNYLLTHEEGKELLNSIYAVFVPIANIDGFEIQKRKNANNFDLNRDQTKLTQKESIALKKAYSKFSPHISFDFHEFRPARRSYKELLGANLSIPYDVLFLPTGNLNVHKGIRNLSENMFMLNAEKVLSENGLSYSTYFSVKSGEKGNYIYRGGSSPRSSSTSYALSNSISLLLEIRGIGLGRTSFKRRTYSAFLLAKTFLETAVKNKHEIEKKLNKIYNDTYSAKQKIVLNSIPSVKETKIPFLNLDSNNLTQITIKAHEATDQKATDTRKRPKAYILMPQCSVLIEKLKVLGLEVIETEKEITLEVETYSIIESIKSSKKFEGIYINNVKTSISSNKIKLPKGSYIVRMNQKNANYAAVTLEPEISTSFVSYAQIKANKGDVLPYYRYLKPFKRLKKKLTTQ